MNLLFISAGQSRLESVIGQWKGKLGLGVLESGGRGEKERRRERGDEGRDRSQYGEPCGQEKLKAAKGLIAGE